MPPNTPLIFAVHPHGIPLICHCGFAHMNIGTKYASCSANLLFILGILGLTVFGCLIGNSLESIAKLGVEMKFATVTVSFWIPFWRGTPPNIAYSFSDLSLFLTQPSTEMFT